MLEPRWSAGKPGPLPVHSGDEFHVGSSTVRLLSEYPGIPRLWFALADRPFESLAAELGGPIHYGYTDEWPMDAYRTMFSRVPGSAEMPSAARPITPRVAEALATAGVRFASVLLHTGVSSLEVEADTLETQAMYPEPFSVSRETADLVNRTHAADGRVIAVGTTVVRALESAWTPEGVRSRSGYSRLMVNPDSGVHAVDGLLTGFHDPVTSHLALLGAFLGMDGVRDTYAEAVRRGYLWHEFGDSHLVLPKLVSRAGGGG